MHLAQDNIDGRYASRAMGPTATMSGPQLMSLLPLQVIFQKRVRVFHRGIQTREN